MSNGAKLLVVDDDPMMLDFALSALVSLGYRTVAAMDAETALRLVEQDDQIQAAIVDMRLGNGPTGAELVCAALAIRPNLHVLLTSGAHGLLQIAKQDMPKTVELLPKPYRRRDLADRLTRLLCPDVGVV
ncbi:response regulator [Roseovarius nitratireducens]|uniref:response regulator n=1 Tax=Roseovarius nitratireducens TaxID=2044597 RepID=UPI000CE20D8D|nr:response regulator [Roseovarius nitratireducens]